jgi:hypothetical protein
MSDRDVHTDFLDNPARQRHICKYTPPPRTEAFLRRVSTTRSVLSDFLLKDLGNIVEEYLAFDELAHRWRNCCIEVLRKTRKIREILYYDQIHVSRFEVLFRSDNCGWNMATLILPPGHFLGFTARFMRRNAGCTYFCTEILRKWPGAGKEFFPDHVRVQTRFTGDHVFEFSRDDMIALDRGQRISEGGMRSIGPYTDEFLMAAKVHGVRWYKFPTAERSGQWSQCQEDDQKDEQVVEASLSLQ